MTKQTDIRGTKKQRLLGTCAGWLLRIIGATLRIRIVDHSEGARNSQNPVLWAFWHNTVFAMSYVRIKFFRHRKVVVLTSASKDGAVLEYAVKVCEIGAVRGSSSRRAVAALVALRKAVKEGNDVCITPDGPRGPKYYLQPGIIKMAESTGVPIVPVRLHYESAWKMPTWDAFGVPFPFSKVHVVLGKPMLIPKGIGEEEFEERRVQLEKSLCEEIE